MEKVIATIVIIVLTMGLISYAIVGQMGGFRDTADVVTEEESRLDTMLKDTSVVPLSTVRNYLNKSSAAGYEISVDGIYKIGCVKKEFWHTLFSKEFTLSIWFCNYA